MGKERLGDSNEVRYFFAVSESKEENEDTTYPLHFINNTFDPIDVLVIIPPRSIADLGQNSTIKDITGDFLDKHHGVWKFVNVPARSVTYAGLFHDWDFDWTNERYVFLAARGEERHYHFLIDQYLITHKKMHIPVLHKEGWFCI